MYIYSCIQVYTVYIMYTIKILYIYIYSIYTQCIHIHWHINFPHIFSSMGMGYNGMLPAGQGIQSPSLHLADTPCRQAVFKGMGYLIYVDRTPKSDGSCEILSLWRCMVINIIYIILKHKIHVDIIQHNTLHIISILLLPFSTGYLL